MSVTKSDPVVAEGPYSPHESGREEGEWDSGCRLNAESGSVDHHTRDGCSIATSISDGVAPWRSPLEGICALGVGHRLMDYVLVCAIDRIEIGAQVLVLGSVSIRDQDHGMASSKPIMPQDVRTSPA